MINTIKRAKRDWNYIEENYKYAKINFFYAYMDVKNVSLTDIEFSP